MPTVQFSRDIAAPAQLVFDTVANPQAFADAIPNVMRVEFRSDVTSGVGTRFWEVRVMNGKQNSTALEVTEYEPGKHVRMVSDAGGTVWDSVFEVSAGPSGSILTLTMDARPHNLGARLLIPLIMGMVKRNLSADMDQLKSHCESVS